MIHTMIIHNTPLVSTAMAQILSNEPDIKIVGCATEAQEALEQLKDCSCDVVVLNISASGPEGLNIVRELNRQYPQLKIIVMGLATIPELILQYFQAGVAGYADQGDTVAELLKKIRCAAEGEALIAPRIAGAVVSRLAELAKFVTASYAYVRDKNCVTTQYNELTRREHQILALIEKGFSNQEIAEQLTIELGTVKNHVHNILRKLNVESRRHAVLLKRMVFGQENLALLDEEYELEPTLMRPFYNGVTPSPYQWTGQAAD